MRLKDLSFEKNFRFIRHLKLCIVRLYNGDNSGYFVGLLKGLKDRRPVTVICTARPSLEIAAEEVDCRIDNADVQYELQVPGGGDEGQEQSVSFVLICIWSTKSGT